MGSLKLNIELQRVLGGLGGSPMGSLKLNIELQRVSGGLIGGEY